MQPTLERVSTGESVLVWRHPAPVTVLSSASVGGGLGRVEWLVNIEVDDSYRRTDLAAHVAEVARDLDLAGSGVGLLTAARVERVAAAAEAGVEVHATVGLSVPTWAAAAAEPEPVSPGTVNIVVDLPVRCSEAALVNMVMTITEAKTQALVEAGVPGTGTASDAVAVTCPADGEPVAFGGPRSQWGRRVARCVHAAVASRIEGA
ncbi:MAG: adenosylcobinamide amidohydrolase [Actinomycetota bacterium]